MLAAGADPRYASPGVAGFLVVFLLAVATWLLIRSMVGHLRKVRYVAEAAEKQELAGKPDVAGTPDVARKRRRKPGPKGASAGEGPPGTPPASR